MAAMVRPSLILQMDLDERASTDEAVAEIKRSYSYVAPVTVVTHAPGEGPAQNVMRFRIRLREPYWDTRDPRSDALWSGMMRAWLLNMLRKVSSTVVASNTIHRSQGESGLAYAWVELEFDANVLVAVKTAADSSIPETAAAWIEQVRDLMGASAFGDGVPACVRIPSRASWGRQRAAAVEAVAAAATAVDANADAAAADESVGVDDPSFEIDYTVWGVELADGTQSLIHN